MICVIATFAVVYLMDVEPCCTSPKAAHEIQGSHKCSGEYVIDFSDAFHTFWDHSVRNSS